MDFEYCKLSRGLIGSWRCMEGLPPLRWYVGMLVSGIDEYTLVFSMPSKSPAVWLLLAGIDDEKPYLDRGLTGGPGDGDFDDDDDDAGQPLAVPPTAGAFDSISNRNGFFVGNHLRSFLLLLDISHFVGHLNSHLSDCCHLFLCLDTFSVSFPSISVARLLPQSVSSFPPSCLLVKLQIFNESRERFLFILLAWFVVCVCSNPVISDNFNSFRSHPLPYKLRLISSAFSLGFGERLTEE